MSRGRLRIYLGAAPGVGKTYAMLGEGRRRAERGADVVVGLVETHARPKTAEMIADLEVLPRREVTYRGVAFAELDVDAVIRRRPEVALIDELAHTNVPGSANTKRWQDIDAILDAGIDVITTINIQHLESLNDVVEGITGVKQRETVPDEVVRRADQVEIVDMTAEALRRRMAHGNIYPADRIDAALGRYFRVGNLTALRELALLWLADKVDDQLDRYRAEHGISGTWETRERVVVALTGGPEGETLIRRAARIAERTRGADLLAVHVGRSDGLAGADRTLLAAHRQLVEGLGGTYHEVLGDDVPRALLEFAAGVNATQLVLGTSRRGRFARALSSGVGATVTARSGSIDVHLVTHGAAPPLRSPRRRPPALSRRRQVSGFATALVGLPVLTVGLSNVRTHIALSSDIMLFLMLVVAVALIGGLWPALTAALVGSALLNYYFTPPIHRWTISHHDNLLGIAVFVCVAIAVSAVVDLAARRARDATRSAADAEILASLADAVLRGERAVPDLLARLRDIYALTAVALLQRNPDGPSATWRTNPAAWHVVAGVGDWPSSAHPSGPHDPPAPTAARSNDLAPSGAETEVALTDDLVLVLRGPALPAGSRRVLEAFGAQTVLALRQQRLTEAAEATEPLLRADQVRRALLSAVSHDLRTPLASARAAVQSLRNDTIVWQPEERVELLATATESLDRLDSLVINLLDMSRLQADALGLAPVPLAVEDVVPHALDELGPAAADVRISVPPDLPEILADPGLLDRILVNLVANAVRFNPPGSPVLVSASSLGDTVEIRVVDHGPGIPAADRERVFQAFQRLGDHDNHNGVGLGLAVARGLAEAMGGSVTPDDTPGGGLTMVLAMPCASRNPDAEMMGP